ncbi:MAG TPA: MmcQ/YjbR family DNA-binding protein [Gemmatimonadaceae bacterium]|nr:MmcQ/YjbR family DNA-binding protein [Gemmatimonadaceae bacterium]
MASTARKRSKKRVKKRVKKRANERPKKGARKKTAASARKSGAKRVTNAAAKRATNVASPLARLRAICLALPEATEVEAWGEPTFRVNGKLFAMHASPSNHHGGGRPSVWIYATHVEQDLLLRARPDRYFKPPYVGPSGWIGAWLDRSPRWGEITELLRGGWRQRAPKKLAAKLGPD